MYYYRIEEARFSSGRLIENLIGLSPLEIIDLVYESGGLATYYAIDCADDLCKERASWGLFQAWTCGDRVLVRLDEHREHCATDLNVETTCPERVVFGEGTDTFSVDFEKTITGYQAREALEYWLGQRGKIDNLHWS